MAKTIEGLYYSESHEWVKVDGNIAVVGITDFAQHAMGDLSYVDMPEVDDELEKGDEFGAVEKYQADRGTCGSAQIIGNNKSGNT